MAPTEAQEHGANAHLFSGKAQTESYAACRPRYPPHLYEAVLRHLPPGQRQLAVDLGCGSGQATSDLARLFDAAVGVDASAAQLAHAARAPNVSYRHAPVEATGLPPGAADLVTAATALHWFDREAVYREARRILRPGGVFAAWSYSGMRDRFVPDNAAAEQACADLLAQVWPFIKPPLQQFILHFYEGYEPGPEHFAESERVPLEMEVDTSVAQLVGLVRSWSAFRPYCAAHGEAAGEALLARYAAGLLAALGLADEHAPVHMVWRLELLLARGPVPLPAEPHESGAAGDAPAAES